MKTTVGNTKPPTVPHGNVGVPTSGNTPKGAQKTLFTVTTYHQPKQYHFNLEKASLRDVISQLFIIYIANACK